MVSYGYELVMYDLETKEGIVSWKFKETIKVGFHVNCVRWKSTGIPFIYHTAYLITSEMRGGRSEICRVSVYEC